MPATPRTAATFRHSKVVEFTVLVRGSCIGSFLWPVAAAQLHQQGFNLQDPEVDDVVRTAKDLEAGYIEPDTSLTAEENVELLLRTTRLLQLGLEVQYAESQTVLAENNTLRGDLRVSAMTHMSKYTAKAVHLISTSGCRIAKHACKQVQLTTRLVLSAGA